MMVIRHFAWFRQDNGRWIGEWCGRVPAPDVPLGLVGDARLTLVNAWLQEVQRGITPFASAHPMIEQAWDHDAWDDCPDGGAGCFDVTLYRWPVGDFIWAMFDGVDQLLDFRQMRTYIEVTPETAQLDVNAQSPRPIRSVLTKLIADITGTPLEPFAGRLFGRFCRRDGRIVFVPTGAGSELPEAVTLSLTDQHPALGFVRALDPAALPLHTEQGTR